MRLTSGIVWGVLAFLLEAVAFLFVGLEVRATLQEIPDLPLPTYGVLVVIIVVVLVLTRAAFVVLVRLVTPQAQRTGRRTALVIIWAGARGPVSALAAFSIPVQLDDGTPFPGRNGVLALTFGVIIITLAVSLTLAPLVRRLGFEAEDQSEMADDARDRAASAADRAPRPAGDRGAQRRFRRARAARRGAAQRGARAPHHRPQGTGADATCTSTGGARCSRPNGSSSR